MGRPASFGPCPSSRQRGGHPLAGLVVLHCPPTDVYYRPEFFGNLDRLVEKGKLKYLGVSVEKVEEGLKAIEYPNVASVQIIYNMFRQRPDDFFLARARSKGVAVIARVPLASGLLSGKMTDKTTFAEDDHRSFNRHGEASMSERPLPACLTMSLSMPSKSCARWFPPVQRWRRWRFDGS